MLLSFVTVIHSICQYFHTIGEGLIYLLFEKHLSQLVRRDPTVSKLPKQGKSYMIAHAGATFNILGTKPFHNPLTPSSFCIILINLKVEETSSPAPFSTDA